MDDLNCCLSQIVHLCNEASIFLNQLYKFECQFEKFYLSYKILSKKSLAILDHFSIIINDLNIYYKNDFFKYYSKIFNYLSRKYFTINYSNDRIEDFYEDLNHLNYFLNHQKKYYKNIFDYLHKLSITCSLCIQYRQLCTNFELANRFVYIRIDLLTNLKKLNEEIRFLLVKINLNFQQKKIFLRKNSKEKIQISNLFRTIFLWFILFIITCYFLWPIVYENKPRNGWLM
jgi:hypothetical protein